MELPDDDIGVYLYPNFNLAYFQDTAERFEEAGVDYGEADVLFAGGTLYGHVFKADYPGADVTVAEQNPLTTYLQTFIAHELADGADPQEAQERVFDYSHGHHERGIGLHPMGDAPRLDRLGTTREELEQHVERHRDFADSGWWPYDYGIPDQLLHETAAEAVDQGDVDDILYAALIDETGTDAARLSLEHANLTTENNPAVLRDVDTVASVDSIEITDITEFEGDYDVVFTNNVFDYIPHGDVTEVVDSITAEDGAYMEVALLGTQFYMNSASFDSREAYRSAFDDQMPASIELMETGPDVQFFREDREEMQDAMEKTPDIVRLYQPSSA